MQRVLNDFIDHANYRSTVNPKYKYAFLIALQKDEHF